MRSKQRHGKSRDPSLVDDVRWRMKTPIITALLLETDCGEDARMRPL